MTLFFTLYIAGFLGFYSLIVLDDRVRNLCREVVCPTVRGKGIVSAWLIFSIAALIWPIPAAFVYVKFRRIK